MKTTIGGDRLGSGNKQEISMRNYERSTHDLSYLWRSSMAAGTLVPFMSIPGLPGDTFDIDLQCEVMTLPTVGPLFGGYKIQADVFMIPIRLYNAKLHMNMLGVGMNMDSIYLPQMEVKAKVVNSDITDNTQINPSALLSYLNVRGLGRAATTNTTIKRQFNAVPLLAYWDIFKQYYSNKQEDDAYVIHNEYDIPNGTIEEAVLSGPSIDPTSSNVLYQLGEGPATVDWANPNTGLTLELLINTNNVGITGLTIDPTKNHTQGGVTLRTEGESLKTLADCFRNIVQTQNNTSTIKVTCTGWIPNTNYLGDQLEALGMQGAVYYNEVEWTTASQVDRSPVLTSFPLKNIDDMRLDILSDAKSTTPFVIDAETYAPYGLQFEESGNNFNCVLNQEGLAVKTYQSDLFNNWIDTEFIDGDNGVNAVTAVSTAGNSFTIDALNLANKVYVMLNRIAISGGTYDDWLDATYVHERNKGVENPVYMGSLIKQLAFEEVISNAATNVDGVTQPLGELGGRGRLTSKNKGGKIKIKCDEPCYIMGIVSLTPLIDYSQGNQWDMNLKSLNDFHKPQLDAIGYQDLVTDQMAWFDTVCTTDGQVTYKSAGKQPAWINYMTDVNKVKGNFAAYEKEGFMVLNRRYEYDSSLGIKDLTTYIDPVKFNQIFAQTSRDAQNFWVQIGVNNTARRKMSAKVIPNL